MKASSTKPKRVITLELDEDEATILVALIGGTTWNLDKEAGRVLEAAFNALDDELPGRIESFSTFFKGDPQCK